MATFAAMYKNPLIDEMRLDGGVLCLDFVNTIPDRVDGTNRDHLQTVHDLLYWAKKAGAVDGAAYTLLEKAAGQNERKAKEFFAEAIHLRDLVYAIFHPISRQQKVKAADLETFNKLLARYFTHLEVGLQKEGFVERWSFDAGHFYNVTAPILKSAHALLLSDKLARVKECPNCGWLFLDTTKNGKRRWCSMEDCGSNVKALSYYYRRKKEQE